MLFLVADENFNNAISRRSDRRAQVDATRGASERLKKGDLSKVAF